MYLNPNFNEIRELRAQRPDTLRIIIDGENLAVANGYGATHTCLMRKFRIRGEDLIFDCAKKVLILICDEDEEVKAKDISESLTRFFEDFIA